MVFALVHFRFTLTNETRFVNMRSHGLTELSHWSVEAFETRRLVLQ